MRHTRRNYLWRDGSPSSTRRDLTPALGTWFNCNLETGEILSLSIIASFSTSRDGSGRSSDFTRGYFTSEGDSLSS